MQDPPKKRATEVVQMARDATRTPMSQALMQVGSPVPLGGPHRTMLSPAQEQAFRQWYLGWATRAGLDPDPDNPLHQYDYRGAYAAGESPAVDPGDSLYHWPSRYKDPDHPNRFVGGVDTKAHDSVGKVNPSPPAMGIGRALLDILRRGR
jgi:hypothetical protein